MDLKETDILGDDIERHWYYRAKARAMRHLLGRTHASTILDVGAGSGYFSRHLLEHTAAREAWCVDISYDADSDAAQAGKPVRFRRSVDAVDADLLLMMDVLEHVDDDVGLLAHYAAKIPPGSRVLISVPAFQFLWSGHDVFLEHRRRYSLAQIEAVVRRADLQVCAGAYFFGSVFPLAAGLRMAERMGAMRAPRSQLRRHHPLVNGTLSALCGLELPFMRFNRVAGLSAFCLARTGAHGAG